MCAESQRRSGQGSHVPEIPRETRSSLQTRELWDRLLPQSFDAALPVIDKWETAFESVLWCSTLNYTTSKKRNAPVMGFGKGMRIGLPSGIGAGEALGWGSRYYTVKWVKRRLRNVKLWSQLISTVYWFQRYFSPSLDLFPARSRHLPSPSQLPPGCHLDNQPPCPAQKTKYNGMGSSTPEYMLGPRPLPNIWKCLLHSSGYLIWKQWMKRNLT